MDKQSMRACVLDSHERLFTMYMICEELMVLLADICVERYEEQLAARIAAYKAENPSAAGAEVGALIFDEVCRIRGFSVRRSERLGWRDGASVTIRGGVRGGISQTKLRARQERCADAEG